MGRRPTVRYFPRPRASWGFLLGERKAPRDSRREVGSRATERADPGMTRAQRRSGRVSVLHNLHRLIACDDQVKPASAAVARQTRPSPFLTGKSLRIDLMEARR